MLSGRKPIGTVGTLAGVPSVHTEFMWSFAQFVEYNARYVATDGECVHYDRATVSFHSWARNGLVERMKGDFLLQLDTDHQFEPDLLGRLWHRMIEFDLDVVCGVYQFRKSPHSPVLYGWHNDRLEPLAGWGDEPVIEIGAAGGGCLLVHRKVFDRIESELGERPFDVIGQMGEDLSFFHRLHKLNIKAYCDTRVECHHLQTKPLSLSDYDADAVPMEKIKLTGKTAIKSKG